MINFRNLKFNLNNLKFKLDLNKVLIISGAITLIFVGIFFFWWRRDIEIVNDNSYTEGQHRSSLSGIECDNYNHRPVAIMMASDPITRPLSGIGEADVVFEVPVTPGGVTRLMAIFQCYNPKEIGSVRSARNDFIPLASGLKAIYAHWGGERTALGKLNNQVIDNLDALKYEGTVFYRKKGIPMPHDGFTNLGSIEKKAEELNYSLESQFEGYPLKSSDEKKAKNISNLASVIDVPYTYPYNIRWTYDEATNSYLRFRAGSSEIDKNNNKQVEASVLVIMKTTSDPIDFQYINIETTGKGSAQIYQDGIVIVGSWEKDPASLDSKLYFYDSKGEEIKFNPGIRWIEIITN